MAIQRTDPLKDLLHLQDRVNRLFDEARSVSPRPEGNSLARPIWTPPLDLFEEDRRYVLRADLPGVQASQVTVRVENGHLVVRGERRLGAEVARESYLRVERPKGRFAAQVALPASVDRQAIRARQQNGVLEIVLPKRAPETAGRVEVAER